MRLGPPQIELLDGVTVTDVVGVTLTVIDVVGVMVLMMVVVEKTVVDELGGKHPMLAIS